MSDSSDADLLLKKRARRRLVGAVAFAGLAAVVLPMVMDDEPKQQVQDVQIKIPGQDQAPFVPKLNRAEKAGASEAPVEKMPEKAPEKASEKIAAVEKPPVSVAKAVEKSLEKPQEKAQEKSADKPADKTSEKTAAKKPEKGNEKAADKSSEKPVAKPTEKTAEKAADKSAEKSKTPDAKHADDAHRAAAILSGKPDAATSGNGHGQFVILIGAFSNTGNVKQLQAKLGEQGIKVFTEPLDSPEGKKTRVRAGPFPSREAAEKAADKMKRIGVNGVISGKP